MFGKYKIIVMLKTGGKMPDFEVVDQDGNKVSSSDLIGKRTIIYFYPKDNISDWVLKVAAVCSMLQKDAG